MTSLERELIATLKRLVKTCKDGENGYRAYAEYVKAGGLTELFHGYARQRANYAAELQSELERRGSPFISTGTIAAALQQGWRVVRCSATGGDDKALLADRAQGEDAAKQRYEEALRQDLPADVRALFQSHCAGVREAQGRLRALGSAVR